jgi:hypothetical protein
MNASVHPELKKYGKPLLLGLGLALYLRFLLIPTAVLFYELHHLTGIDFIYWGYSGFKVAGYYFGVWEHQTLACLLAGVALFLFALLRGGGKAAEGAA